MNDKHQQMLILWIISIFIAIFTGFTIANYRNYTELKQKNNSNNYEYSVVDSLKNENFIQMTIIDRYEIALENLRIEDSISAKKFEDQLNILE
jgi:beta-lactamase regulating signal transducer with metallopeptidase domain